MSENNIKINFDYRKPDEPVLIAYKTFQTGFFSAEPTVKILKTIIGKKAIEMYSELSGKSIEQIEKEAEHANNYKT